MSACHHALPPLVARVPWLPPLAYTALPLASAAHNNSFCRYRSAPRAFWRAICCNITLYVTSSSRQQHDIFAIRPGNVDCLFNALTLARMPRAALADALNGLRDMMSRCRLPSVCVFLCMVANDNAYFSFAPPQTRTHCIHSVDAPYCNNACEQRDVVALARRL